MNIGKTLFAQLMDFLSWKTLLANSKEYSPEKLCAVVSFHQQLYFELELIG